MERNSKETAIPRGTFHEQLREWFEWSDDGETVGDVGEFGGKPWVWVKHLGNRYYINADTAREGVSEYLELLDRYGEEIR